MRVVCGECGASFDDEYRTTVCPHGTFPANDGENRFRHHPESFLQEPAPEIKHGGRPMTLRELVEAEEQHEQHLHLPERAEESVLPRAHGVQGEASTEATPAEEAASVYAQYIADRIDVTILLKLRDGLSEEKAFERAAVYLRDEGWQDRRYPLDFFRADTVRKCTVQNIRAATDTLRRIMEHEAPYLDNSQT